MIRWHEYRGADLVLRVFGVLMLAGAWMLGAWLTALITARPTADGSPMEFLIGLTTFGAASLGAASLVLGGHLFDSVSISDRWKPRI